MNQYDMTGADPIGDVLATIEFTMHQIDFDRAIIKNAVNEVVFDGSDEAAEAEFSRLLSPLQLQALADDAEVSNSLAMEAAAERRLSYGPGCH